MIVQLMKTNYGSNQDRSYVTSPLFTISSATYYIIKASFRVKSLQVYDFAFSEPSCPVDGGGVTVKETTPIWRETFHHGIGTLY